MITDSSRKIERDYARRVVAELYEIESVHKFRVFIKTLVQKKLIFGQFEMKVR